MKRTSRTLIAMLVVGVGLAVVASAVPLLASPAAGQALEGLLGYQVGEERRYTLGPAENLYAGESASWWIRLDRVADAEDGPRGVFSIGHERTPPEAFVPYAQQQGTSMQARIVGEVTVNAHGFPLEVAYRAEQRYGSAGSDVYTMQYAWEDGGFTKRVWRHPESWELRIGRRGHEHFERDVPSGAWAFLPAGLYCQGPAWAASVGPSGTAVTVPPQTLMRDTCRYDEPAFVHPGLLDLAMPTLREHGDGERDFLFFKPAAPILNPGTTVGLPFVVPPQIAPPPIPGQPPVPAPPPSGRRPRPPAGVSMGPPPGPGRKVATDVNVYFEDVRLRVVGPETIEVGRRRMTTTLVDFDAFLGGAWLDDNGTVVRLDLAAVVPPGPPPPGVAGADATAIPGGNPARFIRRLFPSEY